jgi:hypothetical protein
MNTHNPENAAVAARYFKQCKKVINQSIGGNILFGLLFGVVSGTAAFGLYGTVFYFILMLTDIAVKRIASKRMIQYGTDLRLLIDSSVILFIMMLEISNVAFMVVSMSIINTLPGILSFQPVYVAALAVYIIYILIIFAAVFLWRRNRFNPQKYQLENISKGKSTKLVGIGASIGVAIGILLAKTIKSFPIITALVWLAIIFIDALMLTSVSYNILMYRYLKNKPAARPETLATGIIEDRL